MQRTFDSWLLHLGGHTVPHLKKLAKNYLLLSPALSLVPNLSQIYTIHTRNMKRSLNEEKLNSYENIKRALINDEMKPLQPSEAIHNSSSNNKEEENNSGYELTAPPGSKMREMFNYYKSKDANLSKVKDITVSCPAEGIKCQSVAALFKSITLKTNEEMKYGLKDYKDWTVTTIDDRPGLFILHNIFKPESHLEWIHKSINIYCRPPNFTNINQNGSLEEDKNFNLKKLRWATLGFDYDWTAKIYPDSPRAPLPDEFIYVGEKVSEALGLTPLKADTSIVNYYPLNTRLSPHVDRSERDYSYPLVSLSFGQSAIYVSGGISANDEPIPIMLHSGDVLVMAGSQRLVFHGVPRILKTRNFQVENDSSSYTVAEKKALLQYTTDHRVNVTLRRTAL